MLRFFVRRLLLLVPILFGLSILVFVVGPRRCPARPAQALLGERATPQLRRRRSATSTGSTSRSDVAVLALHRADRATATSARASSRPRTGHERVRSTASRPRSSSRSAAMVFAIGFGIPLGFLAAKRYGTWFDHVEPRRLAARDLDPDLLPRPDPQVRVRGQARLAAEHRPRDRHCAVRPHPTNFYVLDAIINGDPEAVWDAIKHLILPAIALGTIPLAIITRITRAVRARRPERGLRAHRPRQGPAAAASVDRRHVLRNAHAAGRHRSSACRRACCSPARC